MLKNMKIGKRLIITFLLIAIVSSISGIVATVIMKDMDQGYSSALNDYGFAQGDIGKAMLILTDNRRLVRDIINFEKPENIEAASNKLLENRDKYNKYAADVEKSLVSDEAKTVYAEIKKKLEEYQVAMDEFVEAGKVATRDEAVVLRQRMLEEMDPRFDELYSAYVKLMDIKVNRGDELSTKLTNEARVSLIITILIMLVAIGSSVAFGVFISHGISKPIKLCVDRLNQLAEGDLTSVLSEIDTKDETQVLANATIEIVNTMKEIVGDMVYGLEEIGNGNLNIESKASEVYVGDYKPLAIAVEEIVRHLSETMVLINDSSDQVTTSSEQVSDGAQSLSQGSTEQAASIEEISNSLNEISKQIKQNAENATTTRIETKKVDSSIMQSNTQMKDMISAMNDISNKSNEIGKIIKTIDDIAFQTNILALNAAVEAARAGSAGKGFAVVADEVRNLAGKSAEAAKNTESLIKETVNAIEKGIKIADNTAEYMLTVVDGAKIITDLVDDMADASAEQASSVNEVANAIGQISGVVQSNAATAEESAAASEELSAQAQMLKQLISKFKINEAVLTKEFGYFSNAEQKVEKTVYNGFQDNLDDTFNDNSNSGFKY